MLLVARGCPLPDIRVRVLPAAASPVCVLPDGGAEADVHYQHTFLLSVAALPPRTQDKQQCTVYKILQVILINFQVHLLFNLIGFAVMWIFESIQDDLLFGYGWFNIILVYQFRLAVEKPEDDRKFCFLPFTIKGKYYPFFIFLMLLALSSQVLCIIAASIIGLYQQVFKKEMLIKLPFKVYYLLEKCVPGFVQNRYDYVRVSDIIVGKCWGGLQDMEEDPERRRDGVVFMLNEGVQLGKSGKNRAPDREQYRRYWEERNSYIIQQQQKQRQLRQQQQQKIGQQRTTKQSESINSNIIQEQIKQNLIDTSPPVPAPPSRKDPDQFPVSSHLKLNHLEYLARQKKQKLNTNQEKLIYDD